MIIDDNSTLPEIKEYLIAHAEGPNGVQCPACLQNVKVYRRRINCSMARGLIAFRNAHGTGWGHAPSTPFFDEGTLAKLGGDWARLRRWNLIEESLERREDGGRAGWWRITELGREYIEEGRALPLVALMYDNGVLGFVGGVGTIQDALGHKFNLADLLANRV